MKEKFLAEDKIVVESVIPKVVAFKSLMAMRAIQYRKGEEFRKAKEKRQKNEALLKANPKPSPAKKPVAKSKSPGKSKSPSKSPEKSKSPGKAKKGKGKEEEVEEVPEEKDPLEMTEEEIYLKRMSDEANVDLLYLSEEQKRQRLEEAERKKFGRYWVWEGYFNEKNKDLWLDTVEALKHINEQVIEDIEDAILLEAFKGVNDKNKLQKMIDDDQKERMTNEKKLTKKGADEWYAKALEDSKKRKQLDTMRPPAVWNFIQDTAEEPIPHVLRAKANPAKCYEDGRIEKIQEAIDHIGRDLLRYEEIKWNRLNK